MRATGTLVGLLIGMGIILLMGIIEVVTSKKKLGKPDLGKPARCFHQSKFWRGWAFTAFGLGTAPAMLILLVIGEPYSFPLTARAGEQVALGLMVMGTGCFLVFLRFSKPQEKQASHAEG